MLSSRALYIRQYNYYGILPVINRDGYQKRVIMQEMLQYDIQIKIKIYVMYYAMSESCML